MNKKIIYRNKNGDEIIIVNSEFLMRIEKTPLLLNKLDESLGVNVYTSKGYIQDGETYIGNTLKSRDISLEFTIIAETERELTEIVNKITKVFNPKNDEAKLYYINEYVEKKIVCIIDKTPYFTDVAYNTKKCLVNLIAVDSFWTNIEDSKAEIALWRGNFHFPLSIPNNIGIVMGVKQPSLIVNILNKGDVKTGMVIEFKARGTLTNPSLFNVNTREYIKVKKEMVAGEVIRIDTNFNKKRIESILNGTVKNILNLIDLGGGDTFLQLDVGDNLFRYDAEENLNNLEVSIYYNTYYLGV